MLLSSLLSLLDPDYKKPWENKLTPDKALKSDIKGDQNDNEDD